MRLIQILTLTLLIACQRMPARPGYPVTPQVAADSSFRVEQYLNGKLSSTGTGWIVEHDKDHTRSYIMSAGHVCLPDGPGFTLFKVVDKDDHGTWVAPLMYSKDPDLCLLIAEVDLGPRLLLAEDLPSYGSMVTYVGAPMGMWGSGMAPIFDGRYAGLDVITAPTIGGASGSAIFTSEGVFGVLVRVDRRFNHMVGFVRLQDIRDFLYIAGFKHYEPSQALLDELDKERDASAL